MTGTPSDDLILEQAYLVARGVRPLALIGTCDQDESTLQATITRLKILAGGTAIPYVVPARCPGRAAYGYASEAWSIDLLAWALSDECPDTQRGRVIGLLLGYSPDEIRRHDQMGCGEQMVTWSPPPGSSPRPSCTPDNRGTYVQAAS